MDCTGAFLCLAGACVPVARAGSSTASAGSVSLSAFTTTIRVDQSPLVKGECLPAAVPRLPNGSLACAMTAWAPGPCDCTAPGLGPADPSLVEQSRTVLRESGACDVDGGPACGSLCACAVVEATGDALAPCEQRIDPGPGVAGFCYVDDTIGNPALVADCPPEERHLLAFHVPSLTDWYATIQCESASAIQASPGAAADLGAACIPGDESDPNFPGFQTSEVNIEDHASTCATGICLAANFRGRVSCPYGGSGGKTPLGDPVTVNVPPELVSRPPSDAVYCSCRCDGPVGTGAFCACPSGYECVKLIQDIGVGHAELAGSYCLKAGTAVTDPQTLTSGATCDATAHNCDDR